MIVPYSEFSYLWPPRPENAVMPSLAAYYENKGWVAQVKRQGTCNVIAVTPEKTLVTMNRHNQPHRSWSPTKESAEAFAALPGAGWYVFVAELLHSKVSGGPRDTNYIFDILVNDGEYLIGTTFKDRQDIITDLFPVTLVDTPHHRVVSEKTWIAKNFSKDFSSLFSGLVDDIDEGIVIKNPDAPLERCSRQKSNDRWQVKIRRPNKNFSS